MAFSPFFHVVGGRSIDQHFSPSFYAPHCAADHVAGWVPHQPEPEALELQLQQLVMLEGLDRPKSCVNVICIKLGEV
jgi:hypothetical protein